MGAETVLPDGAGAREQALQEEIQELRALAKPMRGRSIEMINSTAVGGGVAEILNRLVPLAEELDLNIKWDVMEGADDFFDDLVAHLLAAMCYELTCKASNLSHPEACPH